MVGGGGGAYFGDKYTFTANSCKTEGGGEGLNKGGVTSSEYGNNCFWFTPTIVQLAFLLE